MQRISRSEQPAASAVKKMTCVKRFFRKGLTNIWNPREIRLSFPNLCDVPPSNHPVIFSDRSSGGFFCTQAVGPIKGQPCRSPLRCRKFRQCPGNSYHRSRRLHHHHTFGKFRYLRFNSFYPSAGIHRSHCLCQRKHHHISGKSLEPESIFVRRCATQSLLRADRPN